MKESYRKDPASHPDPESCGVAREGGAEALTGAHTDQVLSCEIKSSRVPTPLNSAEGHTAGGDIGEPSTDPAQSETLCMCKATNRTPGMHVRGKSDRPIVPKKPPNNEDNDNASTEEVEGRGLTKGNIGQTAASRTQSRMPVIGEGLPLARSTSCDTRRRKGEQTGNTNLDLNQGGEPSPENRKGVSIGLAGVRRVARTDKRARFTALLHHVTEDRLRESFYEHRIADRRILRLTRKWLRAGVSEDGTWSKTEVGTPQGAVVSPVLANVYLHYVFDLWADQWRNKFARGDVIIVRYADDTVVGFQHRAETFDFLGFTHICGTKHQKAGFILKRKTVGKPMAAKLREVRETLMRHRHAPVVWQAKWLSAVVRGYFNYHAVPGNMARMTEFRTQAVRHWLFALRRRSHKHRLSWARFGPVSDRLIPSAKILHPYPNIRFYAKHPR
ncbi:MAG: hypothetical protein KAV82_11920 [Phycisphaerae bacterium]|nr:hypothetical protein [Phycisphaerae bacterium]